MLGYIYYYFGVYMFWGFYLDMVVNNISCYELEWDFYFVNRWFYLEKFEFYNGYVFFYFYK